MVSDKRTKDYDSQAEAKYAYADDESNTDSSDSFGSLHNDNPPDVTIDLTAESSEDAEKLRLRNDGLASPRAYQLEMLEESLRGNVIVAMDTGSGKTMIAVLRCQYEIEHGDPKKLIWFLAPTVSLCAQQQAVLARSLPSVQVKLLTGADNVDFWSQQSIWDAVLRNVRIVVTTPAILFDVLSHGFLSISSLSLLVFDEAHNYIGKNPGSKIMRDFYRHSASQGLPVPSILGLSASPVMRSSLSSSGNIEETLSAICRTPTVHKSELLTHVNIPVVKQIPFAPSLSSDGSGQSTQVLSSLRGVLGSIDFEGDPWIQHLRAERTEKNQRSLEKALRTRKTSCQDQLMSFWSKSLHIFQELGAWAVDFYIFECISRYLQWYENLSSYQLDLTSKERKYIVDTLRLVDLDSIRNSKPGNLVVSDKVMQFIKAIPQDIELVGIVFVQQRVTAAVLAELLKHHPQTKSSLRVATMVGTSQSVQRSKGIGDFIELEDQADTLDSFRSGRLELLVATSVLNEGIDVPACNFVLCFDQPDNLKTFVQRRGRARQQKSQLVLMQSTKDSKLDIWQSLEAEMKEMYADKERQLKELREIEYTEEADNRFLRVESTGALLDLDNAVSHLNHFCAVLPASPYVDLGPEYIFNRGGYTRVILPLSVDPSLRETRSKYCWESENNGRKDAAFEAYLKLYAAGLVSDHLLPLLTQDPEEEAVSARIESRPSLVDVQELYDPWPDIASQWDQHPSQSCLGKAHVKISHNGSQLSSMELVVPKTLPHIPRFTVHWDTKTDLKIDISSWQALSNSEISQTSSVQTTSRILLKTAYGHRFEIEDSDLVIPFCPSISSAKGCNQTSKTMSANQLSVETFNVGLIRDMFDGTVPYLFDRWLRRKPAVHMLKKQPPDYGNWPDAEPYVAVTRLTRREDFLHVISDKPQPATTSTQLYTALPVSRCAVDPTPFEHVQFSLLWPSILHVITEQILAQELSKTLLSSVTLTPDLIITAITASSASSDNNYQRLEFLGDMVLKTCTSLQLLADHPLWHEGYLSRAKDHIVSNARLAKAAVSAGLDKFIITNSFTGKKWRPPYIDHLKLRAVEPSKTRQISSKVLADVVESLIGASMLSGGLSSALACMSIFLPEVNYQALEIRRQMVYDLAPSGIQLLLPLKPLEELLGYKFTKPSLLIQAMTHASCPTGTASYERLEYLGDAILDYIVTTKIFAHSSVLSHVQMHHLRTALVNADFLAFISMEFSTTEESSKAVEISGNIGWKAQKEFTIETEIFDIPLWKFMRHSSTRLSFAQVATSHRHTDLRDEIKDVLEQGDYFPWDLLARLQAQKLYSDIVEATIGAIYIDSGSFEVVETVLEKMGLLPYLRRALTMMQAGDGRQGINLWHPKEELGIMANTQKVKYVVKQQKIVEDGKDNSAWYCEVFVGEEQLAAINDGVSREEAKTRGAQEAVRVLKLQRSRRTERDLADDTGHEGKEDDDMLDE